MKRVCLTKQTRIGNVETKKYILRAGHRGQRLFEAATLMDVDDLGSPGGTLGGCQRPLLGNQMPLLLREIMWVSLRDAKEDDGHRVQGKTVIVRRSWV